MEEKIRKEIITDLIFEKLFRCLNVENKKVTFDKYKLNDEDMQYLLEKFNTEKYDAYCKMLLNKKDI